MTGNDLIPLPYDQEWGSYVQSHTTCKNTIFSLKSCYDVRDI